MKKGTTQDERLRVLIDLTKGDDDFIREMLGIFIKNTPEAIANLQLSLKSEDFSSVSAGAHKLKSSIQILGDSELHELIRKIENNSKSGIKSNELIEMIEKLNHELNSLISWMKKRLEDPKKFT